MPIGKTKSQGWEIGLRRTFPIAPERAWELLTTQPGLGCWLGHGVEADFQPGTAFTTDENTVGKIRSYSAGELIRLTWQPSDWNFASTLQIRVLPARTGATLSFHQEKLQTGAQREAMRRHWLAVMDQLGKLIDGE